MLLLSNGLSDGFANSDQYLEQRFQDRLRGFLLYTGMGNGVNAGLMSFLASKKVQKSNLTSTQIQEVAFVTHVAKSSQFGGSLNQLNQHQTSQH